MLVPIRHRPEGVYLAIMLRFVHDVILLVLEGFETSVHLLGRVIDLLVMKDERPGVPQNQLKSLMRVEIPVETGRLLTFL